MTNLLFTVDETSGGSSPDNADVYADGSARVCELLYPVGISEPLIRATFKVRHISGSNQDVQFEVASDAAFATVVASTTLTNQAPLTTISWTMGVDMTLNATYFWRARAGDSGTSTWGAWTSSTTQYKTGQSGYGYVRENVGASFTDSQRGYEYVMENIGSVFTDSQRGYEYVMENIGSLFVDLGDGYEYVWSNIDTSHPIPHIWFVDPTSGRPGDGILLIGFGFGDLQATYASHVEVDLGDGGGWVSAGVVSWQRYPADADMYTALREIKPTKIDPQHDEIGLLIPALAIPPGMRIRVVETA